MQGVVAVEQAFPLLAKMTLNLTPINNLITNESIYSHALIMTSFHAMQSPIIRFINPLSDPHQKKEDVMIIHVLCSIQKIIFL
ncbi:hypothetical protein D3C73_835640 [compost metagenome]